MDMLGRNLAQRQESRVRVIQEPLDVCGMVPKEVIDVLGPTITEANPDDLGRVTEHQRTLMKIRVL